MVWNLQGMAFCIKAAMYMGRRILSNGIVMNKL